MNYKKLLKNVKQEEVEKALIKIKEIQAIDEKYKNAYFWTPNRVAALRHNREKNDTITFSINEDIFTFEYSYHESCRNCYYMKTIKCNNEKITMRTINTLETYLNNYIENEK